MDCSISGSVGGGRVVLLVDDYLDMVSIWSMILSDLGYQVMVAKSKKEALQVIDELNVIDILVTDHRLGDGTGDEVLVYIKNKFPNIASILYSGSQGILEKEMGFDECIVKPVTCDFLTERVEYCLLLHEEIF